MQQGTEAAQQQPPRAMADPERIASGNLELSGTASLPRNPDFVQEIPLAPAAPLHRVATPAANSVSSQDS
eukprot:3449842-Alexandrium_andersonii.AAC.1